MRLTVLWLAYATSLIAWALLPACGPEDVPACADVSWLGRENHAQLTGALSVSSVQIAAGDPLVVAVPVNASTRNVSVWVRSVDQTPPGSRSATTTDGGETVQINVENTDLPEGLYVIGSILLDGETVRQTALYDADDFTKPYVLIVSSDSDAPVLRCMTETVAPTFKIVNESER